MDLASTGFYSDKWLIDKLEDHALSRQETNTDGIDVSDEWEYVDWTMVVTPRIVKPDGQLLVDGVDHDDIETIVIPEGTPCATYRIRFIAGQDQFGIAEIDAVLAPPTDGDTFRLGVDTTRSYDPSANQSLIETFTAELQVEIRVTIELEIVDRGNAIGCRLVNPGMAPYEGALIPVEGSGGESSLTVDHTHNHLPESVVEPRIYQIEIEENPPSESAIVEITESDQSVTGRVVDRSIDNHLVDPHFVEFDDTDAKINEVYIYFCGEYQNKTESTCQECFKKELFGAPSERNATAGDTILLKDYKNSFSNNSDSELYGPFTAVTDETKNIDPKAWGGRFEHQIEVESDELFMLPVVKSDVAVGKNTSLSGTDARDILSELTEDGVPIAIGSDGDIKETDEGPAEPDELESEEESKEEQGDGVDQGNEPVGGDTVDRLTTIHMAKNQSDPVPAEDALQDAPNPGVPLIRPAIDGELRPELYEQALAHLVAGKNIILYGPPGSGKTRIAERLGHAICSTLHIEAANAEWTYQEVVGGYTPSAGGGFKPSRGVLTAAAAGCEQSLAAHGNPDWLLIDELNRANLDEAFGDVFTLLDLDHRTDSEITFADSQSQAVPLAFRILGTMNTEDQAQLFALGYAFRRRFAFIEVPPAYETNSTEGVPSASKGELTLEAPFERLQSVLEPAVVSHFDGSQDGETLCETTADTSIGIPPLASIIDSATLYDDAVEAIKPNGDEIEFPTAIFLFVQALTEQDVADIGQGIILDSLRYVLAHYLLFPTETDWRVVDQSIVAYILPQLESYTSELRRAETVATESDATTQCAAVADVADQLGLESTAETMRAALESHEILR